MWFERRFVSGLIAGGIFGLLVGTMLLGGREEAGTRSSGVRRVTGWLKK